MTCSYELISGGFVQSVKPMQQEYIRKPDSVIHCDLNPWLCPSHTRGLYLFPEGMTSAEKTLYTNLIVLFVSQTAWCIHSYIVASLFLCWLHSVAWPYCTVAAVILVHYIYIRIIINKIAKVPTTNYIIYVQTHWHYSILYMCVQLCLLIHRSMYTCKHCVLYITPLAAAIYSTHTNARAHSGSHVPTSCRYDH